jgi:hypothetical protein
MLHKSESCDMFLEALGAMNPTEHMSSNQFQNVTVQMYAATIWAASLERWVVDEGDAIVESCASAFAPRATVASQAS